MMADHLEHEKADWWWRDTAERALHHLAELGRPFTAWDLTEVGVPDPDHPNRWGALFHHAHQRGVIRPVGYRQSERPTRTGGVCRIWEGTTEKDEAA